jgi:hypothetical protein
MSVSYGYLIVNRHTYKVPRDLSPPISSDEPLPHLPDGQGFEERLRVVLDLAAQNAAYGSLQALLSSPRSRSRRAPARAQHVRELVDAGLLARDQAVERMLDGAVPDDAWEILRQVTTQGGGSQPLPAVRNPRHAPVQSPRGTTRSVPSWTLQFNHAGEITLIDIDPMLVPGDILPLAEITGALDHLAADGWKVLDVSEDRAVNDDASASFVIGQRYLLVRGAM